MHSIATAAERLRKSPEQKALVTALGWFATKHAAGVYSGKPPKGKWSRTNPKVDQATVEAMASPEFVAEANGAATVETYTVAFGRDGEPELGIVIGRLADGSRFFANTPADKELLTAMTTEEFVGRPGRVAAVTADGVTRNVFTP
jgi:acetyl-CoA C-acetyltransferase